MTSRRVAIFPLVVSLAGGIAAAQVPADVLPPTGNRAAMTLSATGDLTYECRAVADKPDTFAWAFVGPDAKLWDAGKKEAGRYYAGPTWQSTDGSEVRGTQVATSPGRAGAIPLQLVKAASTSGTGTMSDVTFIQRLNTVGGIAPTSPACGAGNVGAKTTVSYSADYVFFKKG